MSNKIKCSHILVKKQNEAITVLDRIKNGEKFGKIAKELSLDSGSAKRDGNLGYFSKGKMVKEYEDTFHTIYFPIPYYFVSFAWLLLSFNFTHIPR